MNLQQEYSKIIESEEYKEFKKNNPNSHLSSVFLDNAGWQFNFFYDDKLITFYLEDSIIKTEESEIYEKKEIKELKLDEVKVSKEEVEEILNKSMEEHGNEKVNKKIIILQQKEVPFWNITYITTTLNVLNVKINAITKEIIEQKFENIMKFKGTQ
jgi:hypothetical protein|tara:strand:+ start:1897 stop:2364 length:468 start_codon:yes stop_codon:yes gene_type:complete